MDLQGKVLYTICKKKLKAFEQWDGYRTSSPSNRNKEKPGFQVKRKSGTVGYRIVNIDGHIVAEAKQKLSSSGVVLGDDVLTLEVVPHMDHSLIMAIVIVYGLICRKM
ncbi:protein LURP-one-related 4-like [Pyrus ussuriensis x Pyrus communis]|uniref:Protein LURP-one-related 4-like n=1 Tax=Pyrus ussuriensis x Pyrus communis TaxID=2448454 RepID=A0A5N5G4F6_9ROSA|nr:protein LURP-one-related 4-like [Pyrus ussuriensis x Pyrus communis]